MPEFAWELVGVLPNLALARPFESTHAALAPVEDAHVQAVLARSLGARTLVNGFVDPYRRPIAPTVFLARWEGRPADLWTNGALIDFRNAVALSVVLRGRAGVRSERSGWDLAYSDFFDLHPTTLGTDGGLLTLTPALGGYSGPDVPFIGTSAPYLSRNLPGWLPRDDTILDPLLRAWEEGLIDPTAREEERRRLFRALQVAYQASATPMKNQATIHDLGVGIALWVSALEILVHPGGSGQVGRRQVIEHLGRYEEGGESIWRESALRDPAYGRDLDRNLIQELCWRLYDARNDFLHGNPIDAATALDALPGPRGGLSLWDLAPIIFRVALYIALEPWRVPVPWGDAESTEGVRWMIEQGSYEDCLLRLIGLKADED